ncbi:MAG TPA: glycosyltransferase [Candidatus Tectomicrobia bacterium]|nr:glycosyltransferase [Candidatus Tectomicrobia bacterium]
MMKRLLVYCHDTYGLGNIRRMLAICEHLLVSIPDLLILIVTGSPMVHGFRMSPRLDYIKLPCLSRTTGGNYAVKTIGTALGEAVKLRSELILTAVTNFGPDLLLVDKKPYGVENELQESLAHVQTFLPRAKQVLLLRDILDSPEATRNAWEKHGYHNAIRSLYDLVLVVGMPEVFDLREEYRFPAFTAEKVRFCGYIGAKAGLKSSAVLRKELQVDDRSLIVVTAGGGEDGYHLLATYIAGLAWLPAEHNITSLIVCGPEMSQGQRAALQRAAASYPHAQIHDFCDDMRSYLSTADVIVSMGGYNTVCEILSFRKRAIVVPRVKPVGEQWIRAERMARLGLFQVIHPDYLTPVRLIRALEGALGPWNGDGASPLQLDMGALPRISHYIATLLHDDGRRTWEPVSRGACIEHFADDDGQGHPAPL